MKKVFFLLSLSFFLYTPSLIAAQYCTGSCQSVCYAKGLFETYLLTSSQRNACVQCYTDVSSCAVKPLTREECEALFLDKKEAEGRCGLPLYYFDGRFSPSCPHYNPPCNTQSWTSLLAVERERDATRMQQEVATRATATAYANNCSKLLSYNIGCQGHCWNSWRYECAGNKIVTVHICTNGDLQTENKICTMLPRRSDDPISNYGNYYYQYSRRCDVYDTYYKACLAPKPQDSTFKMTDNIATTPCDKPSGKEPGGIHQCYQGTAYLVKDKASPNCKFGNLVGWKVMECAQIPGSGSRYPVEWDDVNLKNYAFHAGFQADNETAIGNAGVDGFRCGRVSEVTPAHWQIVDGGAYADGDLTDSSFVSSDPATNCAPPATSSAKMAAGVRQTSQETGLITKRQDYDYFLGLLNENNLPACSNVSADLSNMAVLPDAKACIIGTGDDDNVYLSTTVLAELANFPVDSQDKRIIFVNGNLIIDQEVITPVGAYLSFIVKGSVKITKELGDPFNNNSTCFDGCSTSATAHVQAVVVADSITVEGDDIAVDTFNPDAFCDRRLSLAGSFVSWTGDISLNRTFKGCGLAAGEAIYPDCNKGHAGVTIFYRPDFLTNAPTWLKQPHTFRFTTI